MTPEEQQEYLNEVARNNRDRKQIEEQKSLDLKYKPRDMNCERMPWGCWIVLSFILFVIYLIVKSNLQAISKILPA